VAFNLYMFSGYPYDKPCPNNKASVRAEVCKVHREFRTQRGPHNVASVLRRTVQAGNLTFRAVRADEPGYRLAT